MTAADACPSIRGTAFTFAPRLAHDDPWESLKRYGVSAFHAHRASADLLLAALDEVGVVLVQVGELEGFAPALRVTKGASWLSATLEAGAERQQDAQEYASRLVAALLAADRRVTDIAA